jgi:hypothetical protein
VRRSSAGASRFDDTEIRAGAVRDGVKGAFDVLSIHPVDVAGRRLTPTTGPKA